MKFFAAQVMRKSYTSISLMKYFTYCRVHWTIVNFIFTIFYSPPRPSAGIRRTRSKRFQTSDLGRFTPQIKQPFACSNLPAADFHIEKAHLFLASANKCFDARKHGHRPEEECWPTKKNACALSHILYSEFDERRMPGIEYFGLMSLNARARSNESSY